jgi:hypothetical protein
MVRSIVPTRELVERFGASRSRHQRVVTLPVTEAGHFQERRATRSVSWDIFVIQRAGNPVKNAALEAPMELGSAGRVFCILRSLENCKFTTKVWLCQWQELMPTM